MADKVMITKSKLDDLANAIGSKSGEATPMTIAKMQEAVENMKTGGVVNLGWYDIKQAVNMGVDPSFLPIGTQITDKWTWQGTTYDAPWNVVHYNSNGMYLQWEYATPETMEFDAPEAMYYVGSDGLEAGTYYFSIGYTESGWNKTNHIQFTLSQSCDPGDQFVLGTTAMGEYPHDNKTITVYGKGSTIVKQTAKTSNGTEGIELGTFGADGTENGFRYQKNGNCNGVYTIFYGSNRWSQSALRQWLNSDKSAGEWWQPLNPWDRPPDYAANRPGFLYGCSEEFKAMLEPVEIVTALNTVSGFSETTETTYDKIFISTAWQLYSSAGTNLFDGEGEYWDYWKQKAEDTGIHGMMINDTAAQSLLKKYGINKTSESKAVWLRSPVISNDGVRYILASGTITNATNAKNNYQCCPACIIKKSTPSYLIPSNLDWTAIKKMATLGTDSSLEVGTQIVDSWNRSDNGNAIQVPWDIVHYDDKNMVLQWHYTLPFDTPFDEREALYYVGEDGLAAGTYYISIGYSNSQWTTARHIQFTLEQACDPGDQLCINVTSASTNPTASKTITVYGYGSTVAKQTATTSNGTDGIELGSTGAGSSNNTKYKSNGQVNGIYWVFYGNHRWSQSALRQWLNSDGAAGEWWRPANPWDRPPSYVNYPGFLYGCSTDFKNAIAVSENKTLLDTVSGFTDTYETTYDKIYLASLEELYTVSDVYGIEGEPWLYYKQQAENAGLIGYMSSTTGETNNIRIKYKYDAQTSSAAILLRSLYRNSDAVRDVTVSGGINNVSSYALFRCCPVCKISLVK